MQVAATGRPRCLRKETCSLAPVLPWLGRMRNDQGFDSILTTDLANVVGGKGARNARPFGNWDPAYGNPAIGFPECKGELDFRCQALSVAAKNKKRVSDWEQQQRRPQRR